MKTTQLNNTIKVTNTPEINIVKQNILGQLEDKTIAPLAIAGVPGIGKTTIIKSIAKEFDMDIHIISIPAITIENLSGLPCEELDSGFEKYSANKGIVPKSTVWTIPEIIADTNRKAERKNTILLLDDFHDMATHLRSYFYRLLLERSLGNFSLADNVAIVLTMNDSEQAGFTGISSAIRNRMSILPMRFNASLWLETFGKQLDYRIASFLESAPKYICEDESVDLEGFGSPRAWTAISKEIKIHNDDFVNKHAGLLVGMQVSKEATMSFTKHLAFINAINFNELVQRRVILDIKNEKDKIRAFLLQYITNFIHTVEDGMYLAQLIVNNTEAKAFIGFILGDIAVKEQEHLKCLSEGKKTVIPNGILFLLDLLCSDSNETLADFMEIDKYDNVTKKDVEKLEKEYSKFKKTIDINIIFDVYVKFITGAHNE